jgi:glycosyltransferase involved in cell wall biosynthesis
MGKLLKIIDNKIYTMSTEKDKKIAIIYHYISHYRVPIFNVLSRSVTNEYTIISGTETDIKIKLADNNLKNITPEEGGLRWIQIENKWILKYFLWQRGLLQTISKSNFDALIFLGNMYYLSTWIAAVLGKLKGRKIIIWTHGFIRDEKGTKGVLRSLFYRLADDLLVYGHRAKDILVSKGFDAGKIKVVYNSLDYDNQLRIRKNNPVDKLIDFKNTGVPAFGFIGRLTKQKKLNILIETLNLLHARGQLCNLLIIGEGDDLAELQALVNKYNLDDYVYFYGPCYDEATIYSLFKQIQLIVSPGEVGLTGIHAMTYGMPVLTHDKLDMQMPEYECIKPGVTGDFFDYDNPIESLTDLLQVWFKKTNLDEIKEQCYQVIDDHYNPYNQMRIMNSAVLKVYAALVPLALMSFDFSWLINIDFS